MGHEAVTLDRASSIDAKASAAISVSEPRLHARGRGTMQSWSARPWMAGCLLALFCLVIVVPGMLYLPVTDRDEARFAQASRQMAESDDWIRIRFQHEPRHKKPIGVYWLQAAAARVSGAVSPSGAPAADTRTGASARGDGAPVSASRGGPPIWPFRLPSLLAGMIAVLATWRLGVRLFNPLTGFVAGLLLAACPLLIVEAHLAKSDAVLLATIVLAQCALVRLDPCRAVRHDAVQHDHPPRGSLGWFVVFWAALGAGVLVKGPVAPLVCGLTVLTLVISDLTTRPHRKRLRSRRDVGVAWWRALRPGIGLLVAIAVAGPWFVAAWFTTDGGFFREAVGEDLLPKLISSHESHAGPPGLHLVLLAALFFPGSLFTLGALCRAWRRGRRRRRLGRSVSFLLAWLIPAWLVFELMPTKLPHYTLPMYPAVALLTARYVVVWSRASARGRRIAGASERRARPHLRLEPGLTIWRTVGIGFAMAVVALVAYLATGANAGSAAPVHLPALGAAAGAVLVLAAVVAAGIGGWFARRGRGVTAMLVAAPAVGVALMLTIAIILPGLPSLWPARVIAAEVERLNRATAFDRAAAAVDGAQFEPMRVATTIGLHEPSLVFTLGTDLHLAAIRSSAARLGELRPGADLIVVPVDRAASWLDLIVTGDARLPAPVAVGEAFRVFNLSKGEWLDLQFYTPAPTSGSP